MLGPQPCTGSPIVVPDSVALGQLSKPSGAQLSNLWTVTGSVPFIMFCCASECELGSLIFDLVVGRAPEPPHGAGGRSGVSLSFCATLVHPFCLEGGAICRALKCEFGLLGLSLVAGRAPEPPHGARGRSGVPLAFYATLAHPFRSEGGVEHARLPSVGASGDISGELLSVKSEWRPMPHSIGVG